MADLSNLKYTIFRNVSENILPSESIIQSANIYNNHPWMEGLIPESLLGKVVNGVIPSIEMFEYLLEESWLASRPQVTVAAEEEGSASSSANVVELGGDGDYLW